MSYKLILFDADGTLFDYDRAESLALQNIFSYNGIEYDEKYHLDLYRKINSQIWEEFEKNLITAEELKGERFRRMFDVLGIEREFGQFSQGYLDYLSEGAFLIDGAEEIVSKLAGRYNMAIITNGIKSVQLQRFKKSALIKYINNIIISEEVGYPKPHRQIFDYAFAALSHADKKTALIVGDSLSSDIMGGYMYGIDTCWFNPSKIENDSGVQPTYEISQLNQLEKILGI
ncbi:MAG: Pyrimidine 5'-nucleotidase YjjG [Firmicutes bacterium]|nr:Pyrimidine 5'-nucleotidase YjjG [Bacillota bacterium]